MDDLPEMVNNCGPPGAVSNNCNENQAPVQIGRCATWIDATADTGRVFHPGLLPVLWTWR